ncbi:TPA: hypothetical protein EYM82_11795 [Candidatus Poribacteria bacterium]|nr:hypothetical protein [Candidatus Poribacteria bacterium]
MKTLLTFTGFHDPYSFSAKDKEQEGPILSLARAMKAKKAGFNMVILFSTPKMRKETSQTARILKKSGLIVDIKDINLSNPTDYISILKNLRHHLKQIKQDYPKADFFVAPASGTPQMHVCWVLLIGEGEISAKVLAVQDSRHVTNQQPTVSEIDFSQPFSPSVKHDRPSSEQQTSGKTDTEKAIIESSIIGQHQKLNKALQRAEKFATTDLSILLIGETGTGKELFASLIHSLSNRSDKIFLPVNCGGIPETLFEGEFFGTKEGGYTGAVDKDGYFQKANGGTLFLDEFGDLPYPTQVKLLRVVEQQEVTKVGEANPKKVDVRLIAATNRNLAEEINIGNFRLDLYNRMDIKILLPTLRELNSDIPALAEHFLHQYSPEGLPPKSFSAKALKWLCQQKWPGNIRDLRNVTREAAYLAESQSTVEVENLKESYIYQVLDLDDRPLDYLPEPAEGFSVKDFLGRMRQQLYLRALEKTNEDQSQAAKLLGVTPQAINKFVKEEDNLG